MASMANGQAEEVWIFEGLITESDTGLAPDLQSGWVLSGSFMFNSLEIKPQFASEDGHSGRMTGGVTGGEMTIDLYHQVLFEAFQGPGLAGFDFQDNAIEENGRDLLGWFFPLVGDLGETGWKSTWLQIWLMDPRGDMISHVPVKVSPYGIDWQSGWFRITFVNDAGDSAHADGRVELFCPQSGAADEDSAPWYKIASDLSQILQQRDKSIRLLETELSDVKSRMEGLRRMVDLLVEERTNLQHDNALLQEKAAIADPEAVQKLAELTVEKSLLESRIVDLSSENESLQAELDQSHKERNDLQQRLRELESQLDVVATPDNAPGPVPGIPVVDRADTRPTETAVAESAETPEPVVIQPVNRKPPDDSGPFMEPDMEPAVRDIQVRRRGPRKFR